MKLAIDCHRYGVQTHLPPDDPHLLVIVTDLKLLNFSNRTIKGQLMMSHKSLMPCIIFIVSQYCGRHSRGFGEGNQAF